MSTVHDLVVRLQQIAPLEYAAEWDNVGLLLGDPKQSITRVLTCLTVTPEVVDEAVAEHVGMIVSHHPILFRGAKQLTALQGDGRIVWPLARAGIAVYSPHTAYDNSPGGINDQLAGLLQLQDVTPLRPRESAKQYKLVVFVPDSDLARVSDAIFAAGAGRIGNYRECSFRIPGTGTFFGEEASNPTLGKAGRREEVGEQRLEIVCPESRLLPVIQAMRQAHSYEEPAFDLYPLKSLTRGGEGRVGHLTEAIPFVDFVARMRQLFGVPITATSGMDQQSIRKVAIVCGAGGDFLRDARSAKADVFLTGEARFHDFLAAREAGMGIVLPGHYATERPAVENLARILYQHFPDLTISVSQAERDPMPVFTDIS